MLPVKATKTIKLWQEENIEFIKIQSIYNSFSQIINGEYKEGNLAFIKYARFDTEYSNLQIYSMGVFWHFDFEYILLLNEADNEFGGKVNIMNGREPIDSFSFKEDGQTNVINKDDPTIFLNMLTPQGALHLVAHFVINNYQEVLNNHKTIEFL